MNIAIVVTGEPRKGRQGCAVEFCVYRQRGQDILPTIGATEGKDRRGCSFCP